MRTVQLLVNGISNDPAIDAWLTMHGGLNAVRSTLYRVSYILYADTVTAHILRSLIRAPHDSIDSHCRTLDISPATFRRKYKYLWQPIIGYLQQYTVYEYKPPAPDVSLLIGREHDLTHLQFALRHHRCVQLIAPHGIGKTRMVTTFYDQWQGHAFYFDLSVCRTRNEVARYVFMILAQSCRPRHAKMVSTIYYEGQLIDMLDQRVYVQPPLLIFDHCDTIEHFSDFIDVLMERTQAQCLIISQSALVATAHMMSIRLPPLTEDMTHELFTALVLQEKVTIHHDQMSIVLKLIRLMQGNPLAVRMLVQHLMTTDLHGLWQTIIERQQVDLFDGLFTAGFEQLDSRQRTLLYHCSLVGDMFTVDDLAYGGRDTETALILLSTLGFLRTYDRNPRTFQMIALARSWVRQQARTQDRHEYEQMIHDHASYWIRFLDRILHAWMRDAESSYSQSATFITPLTQLHEYIVHEDTIKQIFELIITLDRQQSFDLLYRLTDIWYILGINPLHWIKLFHNIHGIGEEERNNLIVDVLVLEEIVRS